MAKLTLTIALERYDRHMPFFDGTVKPPDGVTVKALQVGQSGPLRDGTGRHERMIHDKEFDIAEFSMSTYLMAKNRGVPMTAVPVFPRRLFSASQMFVHPDSNLWEPKDLIGKKVALSSFQTTLSLLAKGDLKFEYGVPWEEIHWCVTTGEKVKFTPKPGVKITKIAPDADLGTLLEAREIDAFFIPHPPHSVMSGKAKARRLFKDTRAEELRYFRKTGYFPIMHLIGVRRSIVMQHPWLPAAVLKAFTQAKSICLARLEDTSASKVTLPFMDEQVKAARELMGADFWPYGIPANRKQLEYFLAQHHKQGLSSRLVSVEEMFHPTTFEAFKF